MPMHHVIIGAGPAATNALETIRGIDNGASRITLVSDEPPHSRMALPYWLAGRIPREHTLMADDDYYRRLGVEARIGVRVEHIDPLGRELRLGDGGRLAFDDLLIATGSSALGLPVAGADLPGVQPLWTLDHTAAALAAGETAERPRVVMIGAGFVGFIVLNAMYKRGWRLTVVEREPHVLPRMLDAEAAALVEGWLGAQGVGVRTAAEVRGIRAGEGGAKVVELSDGGCVEADLVIVATGVRPNLELLRGSGIDAEEGILVNERMQTNFPYIYAGGDVAQGPVLLGTASAVHAIQPTAVDHGRVAGANMAGRETRYAGSLLMNVLDVCGLQCASFGNWSDAGAEAMTIANSGEHIYRRLLWNGEEITGAVFTGRANDLGMLNDIGMVKGIMQTRARLGPWKRYLAENPFDIRRPYVAIRVAARLAGTTLLGRPSRSRQFHFAGAGPQPAVGPAHTLYIMGSRQR